MNLTEVWTAYMAILRERAPVTAASIRSPRSVEEREAAERATTPWTDELREFYGLHDGQHVPLGEDYVPVGSVLPDANLLSLDEVLARHTFSLENPHPIDYLGDDWPAVVRAQEAGETAEMFVPAYVPFAEGIFGLTYIDTRPGRRRGCVRMFSAEAADGGAPWFDSLTEYIAEVHRSVEAGSALGEMTPAFEDGVLEWHDLEFELDERSRVPTPTPAVVRLPFALIDFRPSQLSDDDDLIDLDHVRRTVIETARMLHPHSVVEDARAVYRQVPRLRGANMNWWVSMDGSEVVFTAIVTGEDHDVIVLELPSGGCVFVVDE
ncbi:SMI1/KNR4 family protein [Rhodococcus sp. IEGM 1330]|uniref:SMI1/KNR4 family protein n=1 Tax=Rhodococcus sp. IEGM 1330 TaxID=3082225 RepID=UPI002954B6F8|nr:SMI1/KNR4 family protein [Rhodococcus sp. IEGM 1330]MDV8024621.1 SMI1/KNR4 family protein [Rhodococcus sp. IEGM 1330]